ncbi:MAG TPA: hypothetical protein VLT57_07445, partial [Bryobacteraceae bacterium]|nr:hypothetical protein [Bryobacteraceae bacterium]
LADRKEIRETDRKTRRMDAPFVNPRTKAPTWRLAGKFARGIVPNDIRGPAASSRAEHIFCDFSYISFTNALAGGKSAWR